MAPEARNEGWRITGCAAALALIAAAWFYGNADATAAPASRHYHPVRRHRPDPPAVPPIEIGGAQYAPADFAELPGWRDDDQLAAFQAFNVSCEAILAQTPAPIAAQPKTPTDPRALANSLQAPCRAARRAEITDRSEARGFFERHFRPLWISRLGEPQGFVTGYYEPVIDGSKTRTDVYTVPVYRRPSNLFVRGFHQDDPSLPNKGEVFRKIGRRWLVPYYDRAAIEDGAIAGRGLEMAWLKSQTDLLFAQIQGSARIRLEDGSTLRINYDCHNGFPYTAVGRILIERGIIPKEQMSMQRIRQWMEQNPEGASEVRRQNRSYVFFREVKLAAEDEPVGAQGVPLTAGRSIAIDKALHVYGTPFFIAGELPIDSEQASTPFRRLMVAQDTGSAITGPARADIYYGAGAAAGLIAGRFRHPMQFVLLVPRALDPVASGHEMPLPDPRPTAKITRLLAQLDRQRRDATVPLPAPRPTLNPCRAGDRQRRLRGKPRRR